MRHILLARVAVIHPPKDFALQIVYGHQPGTSFLPRPLSEVNDLIHHRNATPVSGVILPDTYV